MKISIITPCLNSARYIEKAIQSVLDQGFPDFEHIVIDGGSTDGTAAILVRYDHLVVIREPDQGLYDAINKGLTRCQGEIVGLLNSDDYYPPGIFWSVAERFSLPSGYQAVSGASQIFCDQDGAERIIKKYPPVRKMDLLDRITKTAPTINAWFFRKNIFDTIGLFDIKYHISGDSDFMLKVFLTQVHFLSLERDIYHYRSHEKSLTIGSGEGSWFKAEKEVMEIAEKYLRKANYEIKVKRSLQSWHSSASLYVIKYLLKRGMLGEAIRTANQGIRFDPAWFKRLLEKIASPESIEAVQPAIND
jgi:glycosyltransferase involved in cell wall biosynthesis